MPFRSGEEIKFLLRALKHRDLKTANEPQWALFPEEARAERRFSG